MKEEEQLHLKRLKAGDKASFRWVYDQYHSLIYHFCLRFIRDEALTKEATADVFITLWQKHGIISVNTSILPFLYKVAKDISYNYLKKIARDDQLKASYIDNYPVIDWSDGETLFLEKESLDALIRLTEKLPARRKEIFQLRYYEGLNNRDIAQKLNISINTVREQLAKARQFLREMRNQITLIIIFLFSLF